jgi:hypothetical protein
MATLEKSSVGFSVSSGKLVANPSNIIGGSGRKLSITKAIDSNFDLSIAKLKKRKLTNQLKAHDYLAKSIEPSNHSE